MAKTNQPATLVTRIKELEQRLAAVERARPLSGATLSGGTPLEVRTPDGDVIMRAGPIQVGSTTVYGVEMLRRDGSLQARFYDTPTGGGYWSFHGEDGAIVASNDTVAGSGLARPYIPLQATPYAQVITPSELTTSATFAQLWRIDSMRQHPWIKARVVVKLDAGTTGEIRLAMAGSAISTVTTLTDGMFAYLDLLAAVPGTHLQGVQIDVEARRVGGAGNVRVLLVHALGRQS